MAFQTPFTSKSITPAEKTKTASCWVGFLCWCIAKCLLMLSSRSYPWVIPTTISIKSFQGNCLWFCHLAVNLLADSLCFLVRFSVFLRGHNALTRFGIKELYSMNTAKRKEPSRSQALREPASEKKSASSSKSQEEPRARRRTPSPVQQQSKKSHASSRSKPRPIREETVRLVVNNFADWYESRSAQAQEFDYIASFRDGTRAPRSAVVKLLVVWLLQKGCRNDNEIIESLLAAVRDVREKWAN